MTLKPDLRTKFFSAPSGAGIALFTALVSGLFVTGDSSPTMAIFIPGWIISLVFILWSGIQIPAGSHVFKSVLAFAVLLLINITWSKAPYISITFCYLLLPMPLIFLCASASPVKHNLAKIFSYIILSVVGVVSVWLFIQQLFLYQEYGPRPHHPMINPNNMASFINIGLLWTTGLFITTENKNRQNILFILTALSYGALIITQSRTGVVGFAISLLVLLSGIISLKQHTSKLLKLAAVFVTMPLLVNLDFGTFWETDTITTRKNILLSEKIVRTSSLDVRLDTWRSTWNMITDHPWMGTGLGSFMSMFPSYRLPGDRSSGYFAHMDPLQFWAEMGILAPIIFYAILICILLRTIRCLSYTKENQKLRIKITASFAAMLAVALHAHMSFPLYLPSITTAMSLMMVIWYNATTQALPEEKEKTWFVKPAPKQILYFAAIIALIWPARAMIGKYYLSQNQLDKAAFYLPNSNKDIHLAKTEILLDEIREKPNLSTEEFRDLFNKTEKELAIVLNETNRNKSKALFRRAELYHLADKLLIDNGNSKALLFLRDAITFDPTYTPAYTVSAQILNSKGQYKEALSILNEQSNWPAKKDETRIYYFSTMADTYRYLGDNQNSAFYKQKARDFSVSLSQRRKKW